MGFALLSGVVLDAKFIWAAIAEDDSGGGYFGEPPSSELLFCRDCGGRLEGWLLW